MQVSQQQKKLEVYKLLPDMQIGYSQMTMNGFGADNQFYTNSSQFQSIQFGLSVPLFFNAQKAMVNAAKIDQSVQEKQFQIQAQGMQFEWQQCVAALQNQILYLAYFDANGLIELEQLKNTANLQFRSGDISYSDWVVLMSQYFEHQNLYFNTLNQYNQNIIHLNYLMGN